MRNSYLFYLKKAIPRIGRLFLGNPDNYRLLGVYTTRFGISRAFQQMLHAAGLSTCYRHFFFGCATGITGYKPRS